jgi:hypothetical protein
VVWSLKNEVMPVNEGLTPSEELPSNAGEGPVVGEVPRVRGGIARVRRSNLFLNDAPNGSF